VITLEEVIQKSGLHPSRVLNVYIFGSQIYGTASEKSDYDILIVAKTPYQEKELVVDNLNIHILSMDRFLEGLRVNNIRNIECLMSPYILMETIHIPYEINIKGLRHSISHTCSNSWVKAMKKMQFGEYYIGIKSLYHALRISMFGTQLAKDGAITNWQCANHIWDDLISKEWTWAELASKYQNTRNRLSTDFKLNTNK
jgi:predicted nucleotidyltransferase